MENKERDARETMEAIIEAIKHGMALMDVYNVDDARRLELLQRLINWLRCPRPQGLGPREGLLVIEPKHKAWIDSASYEELLNKWRFAPIGDAFFHGETGRYYAKVMAERRAAHPDPDAVSKKMGWDKP